MSDTQVIFDMPFEDYLKVEALSATAIKTINVSVSDYIEEKKQDTSTKAKDLGRAYHKRILEGLDAFNEAYAVALNKDDYLCTIGDIKEYLDGSGCDYKKSGSKDYFEDIAREHNAPLFSDALANETREFISQDYYDRINKFGEYLDSEIWGYKTEVTVLWDWDGVPCKARFDAVDEHGILDLKTFSNPSKRKLEALPAHIISQYRYDIQALFYVEAYNQASKVNEFFKAKAPRFLFLWIQSQGGYNAMKTVLQPSSEELFQENAYWNKALNDIEDARELYRNHIMSGSKAVFFVHESHLEDHHLPSYHFHK